MSHSVFVTHTTRVDACYDFNSCNVGLRPTFLPKNRENEEEFDMDDILQGF